MVVSPAHQVWPKPACKAQWKEEEDKADRGRGGKTTSGNGQAWSSPVKWQRAVENRGKWRKLVAKLSVVPQRPSRLRDWWWWWWLELRDLLTTNSVQLTEGCETVIQFSYYRRMGICPTSTMIDLHVTEKVFNKINKSWTAYWLAEWLSDWMKETK